MKDDDFTALSRAVLGDLALLSDSSAAERVQQLLHCAQQQRAENTRLSKLVERTIALATARELEPVADGILHTVVALTGARRGFLGLVEPSGWRVLLSLDQKLGEQARNSAFSSGIIARALETGEPVVEHDAGSGTFSVRRSVQRLQLRSVICVPFGASPVRGFVYLDNPSGTGLFGASSIDTIAPWLPLFQAQLARALESSDGVFPGVLTRSPALRAQLTELARIAAFDVPVLLHGETGTGKSHLARRIHSASARGRAPLVHVNCAAIPAELVESELFGVAAGAYTGASRSRPGRFEAARGGTLFLDELDAMPLAVQAKLLVALQEREIVRLGSNTPISTDVRVLAAMSSAPSQAIAQGRLRTELYYRLSVFTAHLPPLRERREDIPLLARFALEQTQRRFSLPPLRLAPAALDTLLAHDWPGNIRELENALDRAALLSEGGLISTVTVAPLLIEPQAAAAAAGPPKRRSAVREEEFRRAWEVHGGVVSAVAQALGVHARTAYRLRRKFGC